MYLAFSPKLSQWRWSVVHSLLGIVWLGDTLCIELVSVGFCGRWGWVGGSKLLFPSRVAFHLLLSSAKVSFLLLLEQKEEWLIHKLHGGALDHSQTLIWGCSIFWWLCNLDAASEAGQAGPAILAFSLEPASSSPWSAVCLQLCRTLVCVPVALDTHTPEKWIVHCKLLSCLLWCTEQPTCLESSQLAFISADGKSGKALRVGREAIFIHSAASTTKWWTELRS